jgi:hypothetical protein
MTEKEVEKHIAQLKERARAAEYPDDEAKLSEWRASQDNLHHDIERLKILLNYFPNKTSHRKFRM